MSEKLPEPRFKVGDLVVHKGQARTAALASTMFPDTKNVSVGSVIEVTMRVRGVDAAVTYTVRWTTAGSVNMTVHQHTEDELEAAPEAPTTVSQYISLNFGGNVIYTIYAREDNHKIAMTLEVAADSVEELQDALHLAYHDVFASREANSEEETEHWFILVVDTEGIPVIKAEYRSENDPNEPSITQPVPADISLLTKGD